MVYIHRVFNYIFTDSRERLALCAYWIFVIYVSIRRFYSISKQSKTERILLRKYYHLVAVLIFSPAVIFQVIYVFDIRSPSDCLKHTLNKLFFFAAWFLGLSIWCSICRFLNIGDGSSKHFLYLCPFLFPPLSVFWQFVCPHVLISPTKCFTLTSGLGNIPSWAYCASVHECLHWSSRFGNSNC